MKVRITRMEKIKVYLSPSNQYDNLYAYGNTNEMKVCNSIASYAKTALERCGFDVKKASEGQAMRTSISESNNWGADLHIPIHTNAGNGNGTVVFVYDSTSTNLKYAKPIYNAVSTLRVDSKKVDYGVRSYPELAELNSTGAVAVYIEVDFHDSTSIAKWLIENTKKIGEAIAKGVCQSTSVKYISDTTASKTKKKIYRVQVGAFIEKSNVENCVKKLKNAGFTDYIIKEEVV